MRRESSTGRSKTGGGGVEGLGGGGGGADEGKGFVKASGPWAARNGEMMISRRRGRPDRGGRVGRPLTPRGNKSGLAGGRRGADRGEVLVPGPDSEAERSDEVKIPCRRRRGSVGSESVG